MSFFRSIIPVTLISLMASVFLLFLGSMTGYEGSKSGYAVLRTSVSVDDRYLVSILGEDVVSESSQWVLLDGFDSLQKISLDTYYSRVLSFDPRNDGYADKLKSVFINDDKRSVYIPLRAGNWNPNLLDKKLNDHLIGIPYSINYYGVGRPLFLFFIIFASCSLALLVICFLKRKNNRGVGKIVFIVPVLSSLVFFGAPGIGCAALFTAFFIFFKDPITDLVKLFGRSSGANTKKIKKIKKEVLMPYRLYWYFLPVFLAALAIIVIFSQINILFLLAVFVTAAAVFFFSSGKEHRRFAPVMIIRRHFPEFVFPVYILPFVIGVFLTLFFTPIVPGSYNSNERFDTIIDENDYYAHLKFQVSFSTRQFGTSSTAFPAFFIDTDGLPSMDTASTINNIDLNDFPPFPLANLMDFFNDVNNGNRTDTGSGSGGLKETLSLLVLLIFLVPGLVLRKKHDNTAKVNMDIIKKIPGKNRLIGINWNRKLLYNDKNKLRDRKDA